MDKCPLVLWRTGVLPWFRKGCFSSLSSSSINARLNFSYCQTNFCESVTRHGEDAKSIPSYISISNNLGPEECAVFCNDMIVHEQFLTEEEETVLHKEVEPTLTRLPYEYDHWDDAIHGFRETERLHWSKPSSDILDRVRSIAFPPGKPQLKHVHVLDLSENGFIKPHIDSVRFCGDTIAGLSLLSDCVMRLIHDQHKEKTIDILLKRRSLYIMRNSARYDFTHEVLSKELSNFKGAIVPRGRRISVICRSEVST